VTAKRGRPATSVQSGDGHPGVDEISRGGLPGIGRACHGGPGCRQTVFALQALVNAARERSSPASLSRSRRPGSRDRQRDSAARAQAALQGLQPPRSSALDRCPAMSA